MGVDQKGFSSSLLGSCDGGAGLLAGIEYSLKG